MSDKKKDSKFRMHVLPHLVSDAAWCCPTHLDENWRLCNQATNSWMGTVERMDGEEILDLTEWATGAFEAAFNCAQDMVRSQNQFLEDKLSKEVLNRRVERLQAIVDEVEFLYYGTDLFTSCAAGEADRLIKLIEKEVGDEQD